MEISGIQIDTTNPAMYTDRRCPLNGLSVCPGSHRVKKAIRKGRRQQLSPLDWQSPLDSTPQTATYCETKQWGRDGIRLVYFSQTVFIDIKYGNIVADKDIICWRPTEGLINERTHPKC